jgi:hypothetical protein
MDITTDKIRKSYSIINLIIYQNYQKILEIFDKTFDGGEVILFGGFIRDYYIRKFNAENFHKYCDSYNITSTYLGLLYNDPNFHSESKNRMKLPNDIDIFIENIEDYSRIIGILTHELNFKFTEIFRRDPKVYIHNIEADVGEILHIQTKIFKDIIHINMTFTLSIKIDFLILNKKSDRKPPFCRLDFDVNSLYKSKGKIKSLEENLDVNTILTNIKNNIAVIQKVDTPLFRLEKMKHSGFSIVLPTELLSKIRISLNIKDEKCIICHSHFNLGCLKLYCCQISYHTECLSDLFHNNNFCTDFRNTPRCIVCKKKVFSTLPERNIFVKELDILENIVFSPIPLEEEKEHENIKVKEFENFLVFFIYQSFFIVSSVIIYYIIKALLKYFPIY